LILEDFPGISILYREIRIALKLITPPMTIAAERNKIEARQIFLTPGLLSLIEGITLNSQFRRSKISKTSMQRNRYRKNGKR
jgi:hypothetical protein